MQRVLIHYFSGTGNSFNAAKRLAVELNKSGYYSVLHSIENGYAENVEDYSIHIFFFPVYATAVPHIVIKYMRHLPDGKKAKTAVISTNGKISTSFRDGYQGWALHQARLFLSLRNYNVFLSDTLDYPHNVTIVGPPRKEKYNIQIIEQASAKIPLLGEKIAKGEKYHRKFFLPNILWSIPFGFLFSFIGRHMIGKLFAADCSCTACGNCVRNCPAKAISMSLGKLKWNWNCEGCLRCINSCPQNAIQVSTVRAAAMAGAGIINPDLLINKDVLSKLSIKSGSIVYGAIWALLYAFLYIVLVIISDWLIYRMSYVPVLKNIIGFGHTKFFRRYSAENYFSAKQVKKPDGAM